MSKNGQKDDPGASLSAWLARPESLGQKRQEDESHRFANDAIPRYQNEDRTLDEVQFCVD